MPGRSEHPISYLSSKRVSNEALFSFVRGLYYNSASMKFRLRYHTRLRLLLLPYLLGIIVLVVLPALLSLGLAFFRYDGLSAPVWSGDLNFILATTDELFALSVQNSLSLILLPVPLRVMGAFLLAWLLRRNGRFLGWFRAVVYLPSVIPGAAYALAWLWILNPLYGPLNLLLQAAGFDSPGWFADPFWARPGLALISLWQIGEGFLVTLAVLQDIPSGLEDVARIDGAGPIGILRHILLPLSAPVLVLLAFRDAIVTFETSFTSVMLTTGGGPYYATYILPMFTYEQGFDLLSFGVASVGLWVMYLLSGLIVLGLYVIARQWQVDLTEDTFLL